MVWRQRPEDIDVTQFSDHPFLLQSFDVRTGEYLLSEPLNG